MPAHKFVVGQKVAFRAELGQLFNRGEVFIVVRQLPEVGGIFQYHIKSEMDGHRRVVDLQILAASLTREPRPVGPKRGSGNPPACSERAEGSVKATCRARQRFQTKPRPSRFREAQKGGVLGSPSSSASFEFLFEGLRPSTA